MVAQSFQATVRREPSPVGGRAERGRSRRRSSKGKRPRPRIDSALGTALARAQHKLESRECGSITELVAAEKIDRSYLCCILKLILLAPKIVEGSWIGCSPRERGCRR
jgi:hypothetical protein